MSAESEIIEDLRQSYKTEGPLRPVLKTKFGIASGETRLKAVASWPVLDMEKDKPSKAPKTFLDFLKLKAADNIHAEKPASWWEKLINQAAGEYRTAGTPLGEISTKLVDGFGLTKTKVDRYLHEEFKHPAKVRAGQASGEARSVPTVGTQVSEKEAEPSKTSKVAPEIAGSPPAKKGPYAKGTSPSLKDNNPSQFTHEQVTLMTALNRAHIAYEGEFYVAVEAYRCPKCGTQYVDPVIPTWDKEANGRKCEDDGQVLEQMTERCDIYVQTKAGFAVTLEVEGSGSSSADNPKREKLLADKGVRTAHVSNPCAEKYPDDLASVVKAFLL
jgi:hypothetical protein